MSETETRVYFEDMMRRCIDLALEAASSRNYALGALVARGPDVIARSSSTLICDNNDPSAHPEMTAVRSSAKLLDSRYLPGTTLFSTLEPCPMCTSVAIWAKMEAIVFGAYQDDARAWATENPSDRYTWRIIDIPAKDIAKMSTPPLRVYGGILRSECRSLFSASLT